MSRSSATSAVAGSSSAIAAAGESAQRRLRYLVPAADARVIGEVWEGDGERLQHRVRGAERDPDRECGVAGLRRRAREQRHRQHAAALRELHERRRGRLQEPERIAPGGIATGGCDPRTRGTTTTTAKTAPTAADTKIAIAAPSTPASG